jgi:hypothetical protein
MFRPARNFDCPPDIAANPFGIDGDGWGWNRIQIRNLIPGVIHGFKF